MSKHNLYVLFLIISISGLSQGDFTRVKLTPEISMKIDKNLILMNDNERIQRFPSSRVPIAAYTSMDGMVDFGVNNKSTQWSASDIEILSDFYRASILSLYDKVDFLKDTIQDIGGRPFIVFEFNGTIIDENALGGQISTTKYVFVQYTIYNEQVLLFNLSCNRPAPNTWSEITPLMMESIRLK